MHRPLGFGPSPDLEFLEGRALRATQSFVRSLKPSLGDWDSIRSHFHPGDAQGTALANLCQLMYNWLMGPDFAVYHGRSPPTGRTGDGRQCGTPTLHSQSSGATQSGHPTASPSTGPGTTSTVPLDANPFPSRPPSTQVGQAGPQLGSGAETVVPPPYNSQDQSVALPAPIGGGPEVAFPIGHSTPAGALPSSSQQGEGNPVVTSRNNGTGPATSVPDPAANWGAVLPTPPRPQERLPDGWTVHLDQSSNAYFYYNRDLGRSQWERPWDDEEERRQLIQAYPNLARLFPVQEDDATNVPEDQGSTSSDDVTWIQG